MKLIIFTLLLLLQVEAVAADPLCGQRFLIGYTSEAQDCNRCFYLGGLVNKDCYTAYKPLREGSSYDMFQTTILTGKLIDSEKNLYQYSLQHWRCGPANGNPWNSDNCLDTSRSESIIIDNNQIALTPDECLLPDKVLTLSNASSTDQYTKYDLGGKICLAKVSPGERNFLSNDSLYKNEALNQGLICLFFIEDNKPVGRACLVERKMPPPPFVMGVIPKRSFIVPKITDPKSLSEFTFARPGGQVNIMLGEDLETVLTLNLDLVAGNAFSQDNYQELTFAAKMVQDKPDSVSILTIGEETNEIGTFPRPALEERPDLELGSFFPCYSTYTNKFNEKFQAVELFNIKAKLGDLIGKDLYLGPSYLPSNKSDLLGDIRITQCDLCINAKQDDPLYKNGYKLLDGTPIKACKLDDKILIKKMELVNKDNSKFSYLTTELDDKRKDLEAPLRLDYFSQLELEEKLDSIRDIGYKSDTAWAKNLLVEIKPIIPIFKDNNPSFIRAVITERRDFCNIYRKDDLLGKGLFFLEPAGQRERSFCNQNSDYPEKNFTLCQDNKNDSTFAVCNGLYKGPSDLEAFVPDKLCITSNTRWDFIKGGYSWGEKTTKEFMPGLACTFLPHCISNLGADPVPNLGFSIWNDNKNYAFNQKGEGMCQETSDLTQDKEKIYTYQYELNKYDISTEMILKNTKSLKAELDDIVLKNKDKPYLTVKDLEGTTLLNFYKKFQGNLFTCQKKKPKAFCIGGIYGDLDKGTNCVSLAKNDPKPLLCTEKTE
jgi:hypothetical protein